MATIVSNEFLLPRNILFVSLFLLSFFPKQIASQTYDMGSGVASNGATILTCSGTFYDSGGSSGSYANNQNLSLTFSANNGGQISLTFSSFNVENNSSCNYDKLSIYDGTSSSGTLLGSYCTNTPPTFTSTTGSLHFVFTSDGSVTATGWVATISCVGPSSSSSPGNVAGSRLWLKADAGTNTTTNGASVSTWTDNSGIGNNASSGTSPTYGNNAVDYINFNPVVKFNSGNSQYLNLPNGTIPAGSGNYNFFAVTRPNSLSIARGIFGAGSSTNAAAVFFGLGNGTLPHYFFNYVWDPSVSEVATDEVLLTKHAYSSLLGRQVYLHGKLKSNTTSGSPNLSSSSNRLGASYGLSNIFDGSIAEVILYPSDLSATNRNKVESYLAIKYGTTLDQTADNDADGSTGTHYRNSMGTVIWSSTINSANNNRIAAIGRDDNGGLLQKQSKSVHPQSLVTFGLGSISISNASNSESFGSDLSFMFWGDDGNANAWQSTEIPEANSQRLTREWKIQETGSVGLVQIRIPDNTATSGSKLPVKPYISVFLLVDADGDFSSGATLVPLTLNGTNWETTYDFSSGQYFTFLSKNPPAPGGVQGTQLWLKADKDALNGAALATNGQSVTTWQDQSGSGKNFTTATTEGVVTGPPSWFQNSLNFNPAIAFNGTQGLQFNNNLHGANSNFSYFNVNDNSSGVANVVISHNSNDNQNPNIYDYGYTQLMRDNASYFEIPNGGSLYGNVYSLTRTNTGGTNSTIKNYFEGLEVGSVNNSTNFASNNGKTTIGYRSYQNATERKPSINHIHEVIVYDFALSALQRQQVESYLALKYGTTLNQSIAQNYLASDGSTIYWNGTTNNTYKNNITGIGRDDFTLLNQKQSRSVHTANSGDLITMGLGTIAVDNAINSNTFAADKSYLVWGADGGANAWQSTEIPQANSQRLTREWKIQETGTVGTVQIRVADNTAASGGKLPVKPYANVYLLVDSDGDFSSGATQVPMTLNGTNWETTYDFTSGQFFTIASIFVPVPGGVNGAALWLKADKGLISGATTTWTDQSGNNRNGVQSTATFQPALSVNTFNFNPSLLFDGSNDYLTIQNLAGLPTGAAQVEMFAVANNLNLSSAWSNIVAYGTGATSQMFGLDKAAGNGNAASATWGNDAVSTFGEFNANKPALLDGKYTGTQVVISSFGVQRATQTSSNNKTIANGSIGAYPLPTSGAYWNGYVPEIIIYPTNLSTIQVNQVNSYLALKYGITLDQTTAQNYLASDGSTIFWNGTSNAAYKNNIAGIGRDDASDLFQKQSQSVNTTSSGNLVTVGLGTIAANNSSNTSVFPVNKNFLTWGDNLGAITVQNTDKPTGTCGRMTRIWKVQETGGEVGNLQLKLDLSALGTTYGSFNASNLFLIVNNTASFSTTLRSYPAASYMGGIATFSAVDLDNNEYFTLAVKDPNFNPTVSSNSPVCNGSQLNLYAAGGTQYQWTGPNGFLSVQQNPVLSVSTLTSAGTYSVTISTGFGCQSIQTINVIINNCNPDLCVKNLCNNATISGTITATDADSDPLTYTVTQQPAYGTFTLTGQNYIYDPVNTYVGEDYAIIRTCDNKGACVDCYKYFVVTACNTPPICGTNNALTLCKDITASGTLNATDPAGGSLTYTIVSQPSSGSISLSGATYTYTPAVGFEGTTTFTYRATNATGSVDCVVSLYVENCFEECDGSSCNPTNLISGGTYSSSGTDVFCKTSISVNANTDYCFTASLTDNCAACDSTAYITFTVNNIVLGRVYATELTNGLATVRGFAFNTNEVGSPSSINVCVRQYNFGTPGTTIIVTNPTLKAVSGLVPKANDDSGIEICNNSGAYTIDVLSNDLYVLNGNFPTISTAPLAAQGTATVSGKNIIFTPNASYTGLVTFQYQICNGACCDVATVTVKTVSPALSVANLTICTGGTATLIGSITGIDTLMANYQWQWSPDSTTWTSIPGAVYSTYTTGVLTTNSFYRLLLTPLAAGCSSLTKAAKVTVVNDPTVNITGAGVTVCVGGTATLTANVAGGTGTISYQWQNSPNGSTFTNIGGATGQNYTTPALSTTTYYRVLISFTGNGCESATSTNATVTVVPDPTVSVTGTNLICTDGSVVLTATTSGGTGTCTLQWQVETSGIWINISGATSSTYTTPALSATTNYRARYLCTGGGCDLATSNILIVTVIADPTISISVPSANICVGGSVVITATSSGGVGTCTLTWQSSSNNTTWTTISGATSTTYTTPALASPLYYKAVIECTGNGCCD